MPLKRCLFFSHGNALPDRTLVLTMMASRLLHPRQFTISALLLTLMLNGGSISKQNVSRRSGLSSRPIAVYVNPLATTANASDFYTCPPLSLYSILSYGCSVWLSALKTKTSIKTLRSFQRFAAQLITRSFKTAPTESLFVIANLLPLDLKLMKLAGVRYLSSKDGDCFSPSSLKTLVSRVPAVLGSPSIQPTSSFFQPDQPPWGICPSITSVAGAFVPLLSSHPKILRVVFWTICVREIVRILCCCV